MHSKLARYPVALLLLTGTWLGVAAAAEGSASGDPLDPIRVFELKHLEPSEVDHVIRGIFETRKLAILPNRHLLIVSDPSEAKLVAIAALLKRIDVPAAAAPTASSSYEKNAPPVTQAAADARQD